MEFPNYIGLYSDWQLLKLQKLACKAVVKLLNDVHGNMHSLVLVT